MFVEPVEAKKIAREIETASDFAGLIIKGDAGL